MAARKTPARKSGSSSKARKVVPQTLPAAPRRATPKPRPARVSRPILPPRECEKRLDRFMRSPGLDLDTRKELTRILGTHATPALLDSLACQVKRWGCEWTTLFPQLSDWDSPSTWDGLSRIRDGLRDLMTDLYASGAWLVLRDHMDATETTPSFQAAIEGMSALQRAAREVRASRRRGPRHSTGHRFALTLAVGLCLKEHGIRPTSGEGGIFAEVLQIVVPCAGYSPPDDLRKIMGRAVKLIRRRTSER